jgi:hypothetical protein
MARAGRFFVMLLVTIVATVCLYLLIVPLLGYGWHVLHGNYVSYAGWKIAVPRDYYVIQQRRGPAIWKLSFGAPLFDVPFSHVSFYSLPPGTAAFMGTRDSARYEKAVTQTATESGYQLKSKHTVTIGNKAAACLEFARSGKQPRSLVRCAAEDANIYPFFEGDSRYIPDLFDALKRMSQEPSTENREGKK